MDRKSYSLTLARVLRWISPALLVVAGNLLFPAGIARAEERPAGARRVFGVSVLGGTVLPLGAPKPAAADDFKSQYGGFSPQLAASAGIELEGFLTPNVSIFGELDVLGFWALGSPGGTAYMIEPVLREAFLLPITINARYGFLTDGFVPYVNAGIGVFPYGQWTWNIYDSTLFGLVVQAGAGFRYMFSRRFGLGIELKYQYFVNFNALNVGEGTTLPASDANLGVLSALPSVCF